MQPLADGEDLSAAAVVAGGAELPLAEAAHVVVGRAELPVGPRGSEDELEPTVGALAVVRRRKLDLSADLGRAKDLALVVVLHVEELRAELASRGSRGEVELQDGRAAGGSRELGVEVETLVTVATRGAARVEDASESLSGGGPLVSATHAEFGGALDGTVVELKLVVPLTSAVVACAQAGGEREGGRREAKRGPFQKWHVSPAVSATRCTPVCATIARRPPRSSEVATTVPRSPTERWCSSRTCRPAPS